MFEAIGAFFSSLVWAKFLAAAMLFFLVKKISWKRNFYYLKHFKLIVLILVSGDFLYYLLPHVVFPLVQGVLITAVYLRLLAKFTKKSYFGPIWWILNLTGIMLMLSDALSRFVGPLSTLLLGRSLLVLPDNQGWLPPILLYLANIQIILNFVYMGFSHYRVSVYNTEKAGVIIDTRTEILRIPLIYHFFALILGFSNPFILAVLTPLSYFVHLYALSLYERRFDRKQQKTIHTQSNNIKSVIEFMVNIGNAITEKVEIDKVMDFVVKSVRRSTQADGAAVLLVDEFDDVLRVKAVDGDFPPPYKVSQSVKVKQSSMAAFFKSTAIPLGKTILGETAASGKAVYLRSTSGDPRLEQNTKSDQAYISSLIIVPLLVNKKVLGVLAIVSKDSNHLFTKDNFEQMKTFADYTSLTVNNLFIYMQLLEKQEMEREVGIAAEIQGQLLPNKLPKVSSISMAAFSLPAKGVSGDYYDVINIKKGQIMLVMCDVAGKGIPASLVMVMIRTIIHLVAHQPNMSVSRIMEIINWGIAGRIAMDRFATMSLISFDFFTKTLEYSNAAHHPLLIYRAGKGTFENMDTEGIPIGLEKKTKYNQINTKLEKDDIIVLYTDGIIEAMNDKGEQYSLESLEQVIRENHELSPEKIKKKINDDVSAFVGKARQHDDQTFLIMKIEN